MLICDSDTSTLGGQSLFSSTLTRGGKPAAQSPSADIRQMCDGPLLRTGHSLQNPVLRNRSSLLVHRGAGVQDSMGGTGWFLWLYLPVPAMLCMVSPSPFSSKPSDKDSFMLILVSKDPTSFLDSYLYK